MFLAILNFELSDFLIGTKMVIIFMKPKDNFFLIPHLKGMKLKTRYFEKTCFQVIKLGKMNL